MKRLFYSIALVVFVATSLFGQPIIPDIKKLDIVLPAFGNALLKKGFPEEFRLKLEEYQPVFRQFQGDDYYTDERAAEGYAEAQKEVDSSIPYIKSDLTAAGAISVVRWDTVMFEKLNHIWYLDAMLVYRVKPNAKGIAKDFPVRVRFLVCSGLLRVASNIYGFTEYEFRQNVAQKWRDECSRIFDIRYSKRIPTIDYNNRRTPPWLGQHIYVRRTTGRGDPAIDQVIDRQTDKALATLKNYTTVEWVDEYLLTERNDTIRIQNYAGKVFFKTTGVTIARIHVPQMYVLLMDNKTRLFGLYEPRTHLYVKPQYQWIEFLDRKESPYAAIVTTEGTFGFIDDKGNPMEYSVTK